MPRVSRPSTRVYNSGQASRRSPPSGGERPQQGGRRFETTQDRFPTPTRSFSSTSALSLALFLTPNQLRPERSLARQHEHVVGSAPSRTSRRCRDRRTSTTTWHCTARLFNMGRTPRCVCGPTRKAARIPKPLAQGANAELRRSGGGGTRSSRRLAATHRRDGATLPLAAMSRGTNTVVCGPTRNQGGTRGPSPRTQGANAELRHSGGGGTPSRRRLLRSQWAAIRRRDGATLLLAASSSAYTLTCRGRRGTAIAYS